MELMKHQLAAIERYKHADVIPLFWGCGSGKTLGATAIAVAKYKLPPDDPDHIDAVLVIAPNMVERQWALQEIPRYFDEVFGDVDASVYWNKKEQRPIPFYNNRLNFCCVNIDAFSQPTKWQRYVIWANSHKTMVIIDEATRIKNSKAKRTERVMYSFANVVRKGKTVKQWSPIAKARCILTGTPITRGPTDLWSMYEFLEHNYFGRGEYAFTAHYTMMTLLIDGQGKPMSAGGRPIRVPLSEDMWKRIHAIDDYNVACSLFGITLEDYSTIRRQDKYSGSYKNVEELLELIKKDAMTVRTEDVVDLPEQIYQVKALPMADEQKRVYKDLQEEMIAMFKDVEITASTKMVLMIRLNQVTSGFVTQSTAEPQRDSFRSDEEYDEAVLAYLQDPPSKEVVWFDHNPKLDQLLIDMEELRGESVIVCCQFTAEADLIFDTLQKHGFSCCLMTGHRKVGTIQQFQNGEVDVMVANIRVISMGHNLQNSHRMIFYNNTYSLEDRIQVEDRIYRKGQTERCLYTDYVLSNTVDLKILANLRLKRQLSDYIKDKTAEATIASIPNEMEVIKAITRNVQIEGEYTDDDVLF